MKIHTNFGGGNFFFGGATNSGGKLSTLEKLVFATIIVFLTFLGLGVKFSRLSKNSLGGVKIHQVGTIGTVKCVGFNS